MQIKLFFNVLVVLAFFNVAESQNLKLKIESSISQENTLIKLIGYLDSFENYEALNGEIQSFKNTMYKLGYIESKIQSISKINSITSVQIILGNKYENIKIYAGKNIFELLDIVPKLSHDSLYYVQSKLTNVETLMKQLTESLTNSGYPFASVSLDNIGLFKNNQLKANLKIITKQPRLINSIEIKG